MDTSRLKKFAQYARRSLIEQVESKLKLVLSEESKARREYPKAVADLENRLAEHVSGDDGRQQLIEQVAYIWFNRFCALRFMDVNKYNRIMVISPLPGQFQPEILAEAKAGYIDESIVNMAIRENVFGLLNGSIASRDGQSEAFRLLIVAVCNDLHSVMPYMFERIEDYTELLMPDDLLSGNSILAYTREAMTPEACESVESIGWLYQFYISEKKDVVFDGLKKNKKITAENIPAATQLFTPHWIVRYLVENSLGRLWMLNNPDSKVIEQMDYYIEPVNEETDFLKISGPEEIKICDPACGSGHMLTYAYDLLYAIYLDADYDSAEIAEKILRHNIYGIEIDERAAELAAFTLTMKAIKGNPLDDGNNRRRFFRNPIEPNICRLKKIVFTDEELESYVEFSGKDLFTQDLKATLREFEEADNFGSLIQPTLKTPADTLATLDAKDVSNQLFLSETHKSVITALVQADYLSQKYHVVVANPPYMGTKGMNPSLARFAKSKYPLSKNDLFAMFIERNLDLAQVGGSVAMITMQAWMFLSSFEKLRAKLLSQSSIRSMAHLGTRAFDSIGGEVVSTTAFVVEGANAAGEKGSFLRLVDGRSEYEKESTMRAAISSSRLYVASSNDFKKIPGSPIAYWLSDKLLDAFEKLPALTELADPRQGLATSDNERFVRSWHEVSVKNIGFFCDSREAALQSSRKWFPFNKGGSFRKWAGNYELVVNWECDGKEIKESILSKYPYLKTPDFVAKNPMYYFRKGLSWSALSSGLFSLRDQPEGFIFADKGQAMFPYEEKDRLPLLGVMNSTVATKFLESISPTLDFNLGYIAKVPVAISESISESANELISIFRKDWDSYEVSWDFKEADLISSKACNSVAEAYSSIRSKYKMIISRAHELEVENNRRVAALYGLEGEVEEGVEIEDISLSCNPLYKYGPNKTERELELLFLQDTVKDFISYSAGCMFGRYSLDKDGLILANQGETFEDYLKQVPQSSFMADDDNVIPLIDFGGDWFEDDISERFKTFLKVTFGEERFVENLAFIEEALGGGGKRKDIKKFFLKDFYSDHVKRYKKRPIYWMFSSPKGSFNALIYMHRYRPDVVSVVLNDYLREFRTKLQARKESLEQIELSALATQKEKTSAIKAIQRINAVLDEINEYEHDTLYPLASKPPEIDLDDGVKHNYPLFGKALKKVTGLS
ncbi:SAM-dependent methyltransferase [Halioglobus japonicus]|uniref:site-specific DNA-methyltransferase (adenine-specific) n=1 Tax=Halioglobus japonicus TaxID=930805 RepID=A0AAP8SPT8_9GAMM|nr:BREX-1 system adenine-specific DNA-methyltransferase PglX [Halioglobus japonicus]AQA18963.1 SAM-dependent methyltransferase [Halioglobus japonicus]PLW88022.1 BREX-1 system adenine-specific DNA-methyltransferase PglX [Halioglobus japonicus]GHD20486.1 hypothetical protein GCM10007052_30180 [Halioglobus japonicus]